VTTIAEVNSGHLRRGHFERLPLQVEVEETEPLLTENFNKARL
jgi:hypothetical protein